MNEMGQEPTAFYAPSNIELNDMEEVSNMTDHWDQILSEETETTAGEPVRDAEASEESSENDVDGKKSERKRKSARSETESESPRKRTRKTEPKEGKNVGKRGRRKGVKSEAADTTQMSETTEMATETAETSQTTEIAEMTEPVREGTETATKRKTGRRDRRGGRSAAQRVTSRKTVATELPNLTKDVIDTIDVNTDEEVAATESPDVEATEEPDETFATELLNAQEVEADESDSSSELDISLLGWNPPAHTIRRRGGQSELETKVERKSEPELELESEPESQPLCAKEDVKKPAKEEEGLDWDLSLLDEEDPVDSESSESSESSEGSEEASYPELIRPEPSHAESILSDLFRDTRPSEPVLDPAAREDDEKPSFVWGEVDPSVPIPGAVRARSSFRPDRTTRSSGWGSLADELGVDAAAEIVEPSEKSDRRTNAGRPDRHVEPRRTETDREPRARRDSQAERDSRERQPRQDRDRVPGRAAENRPARREDRGDQRSEERVPRREDRRERTPESRERGERREGPNRVREERRERPEPRRDTPQRPEGRDRGMEDSRSRDAQSAPEEGISATPERVVPTWLDAVRWLIGQNLDGRNQRNDRGGRDRGGRRDRR